MLRELVFILLVGLVLGATTTNNTSTETEPYDANGKIVVVTGAAQGIGHSIADNFLEAGAGVVIILDKQAEKGQQVADEFNSKYGDNRAVFIECDITKDLEQVSEYLIDYYGHIDILVNNAGILDEYNPRDVLETNAIGTALWTLKFWEHMSKENGGYGGTIINIASLSGYLVDPFIAIYKSSKAAILGLTKGFGHEYTFNRTGVRVIAVCPGLTYTAMTEQQMVRDEQIDIFAKFKAVSAWQEPDAVGRGTVTVYKNSKSGVIWAVSGGAEPSVAPDAQIVTAEELESL